MVWEAPLDAVWEAEPTLPLLPRDVPDSGGGVYQAVLASDARDALFDAAVQAVVDNVAASNYGDGPLEVTGPRLLGRLVSATGRSMAATLCYDPALPWWSTKFFVSVHGGLRLCRVAYPSYRDNRGSEHYSVLWHQRRVFRHVPRRGRAPLVDDGKGGEGH
jgi:hypothetical protein